MVRFHGCPHSIAKILVLMYYQFHVKRWRNVKLKTYKESLNYLEKFISNINFKRIEDNAGYDPLDRMRTLLGLLGNPEKKFKSVLVTGTAGKGSTAYLISHILKTAGYKVGLTISPHLQKVNERLQINGKEISDEKFVNILNIVTPAIEKMFLDSARAFGSEAQARRDKIGAPSYFEILIAMVFLYFAQEKVDLAVVEVGIEGKYDATNVLNPLMVILTNISLDHTQILGDTVEKIAKEAVQAIKQFSIFNFQFSINNSVVITGAKQQSVIKIVEERCREVGAKLLRLGKDFDESVIKNFKLSLLGDYQKENASLAVEAVVQLKNFGLKVSEKDIRLALKTAFFPGRFEIIRVNSVLRLASLAQDKMSPTLILDGAHNPAKMKAFISSLKKLFPTERKIFVIAFKKDKNIKEMLKSILPVADVVIATRFSMATDVSKNASAEADSIKYQVLSSKYGGQVFVEGNSKKALEKALKLNKELKNSIVVVTGSLYLVGEIRSELQL
ncbi:MAG: folylpolyglutamate synthase/dihydrofolate synthase family protein [Candidatus Levybacteria bacterium]|nr:folylpolyglutamate synthase/dihydrofolate synthase family protein [Candidatus Levybacteria bacterium]